MGNPLPPLAAPLGRGIFFGENCKRPSLHFLTFTLTFYTGLLLLCGSLERHTFVYSLYYNVYENTRVVGDTWLLF